MNALSKMIGKILYDYVNTIESDSVEEDTDIPHRKNLYKKFRNTNASPELTFIHLKKIIDNLEGTQFLIKPFLEKNALTIMYGKTDSYKSFISLDMGLCVAHGQDYHGSKVNQGAVFYICGEGENGVGRRIEAWRKVNNIIDNDAPFFVSTVPAKLIEERDVMSISKKIKSFSEEHNTKPSLIIVDTLSTNLGEAEESSNKDIARFYNNLRIYLRNEFNACVLIIHHTGHSDTSRERGASAIGANADCRIEVSRIEDNICQLNCIKMKDGPKWDPIVFDAVKIDLDGIFDSEGEVSSSLAIKLSDRLPSLKKDKPNNLGKNESEIMSLFTSSTENKRFKTKFSENQLKNMAIKNSFDTKNIPRTIKSLLNKELLIFDGEHYYRT